MPNAKGAVADVPLWVAALALALLMGLQPITTDLYLPALPLIGQHFRASNTALQMTMAAALLVFGPGQLICGPLADRFGRRPVLRIGLGLYVLASLGAALATSIEWLVLMRALQGGAMASAVVCGRAMVRDLYEPQQGAQVMSRGLTGLGVIAVTGPLLGGTITHHYGWRASFVVIACVATLSWLFVHFKLPETQPRRNLLALRPGPWAQACLRMLKHRDFLGYAGMSACSYAGVIMFLSGSSLVLSGVLGLGPTECGLALAFISTTYIGGTFVCRWWLPRRGLVGTARCGALLCLAGGLSSAGLALAGISAVWALLLPQAVYALGHGVNQPCGQTGVIAPFPAEAATASALAGCLLALVGFGVARWLGASLDGTVYPITLGLGFFGVLTALVAWTVLRSPELHTRAPQAPQRASTDA
jgi:DHA1 family bicyclomycin/chloramphenicol resistance-like MFS transporter